VVSGHDILVAKTKLDTSLAFLGNPATRYHEKLINNSN
jgi:hypothetical protein